MGEWEWESKSSQVIIPFALLPDIIDADTPHEFHGFWFIFGWIQCNPLRKPLLCLQDLRLQNFSQCFMHLAVSIIWHHSAVLDVAFPIQHRL